MSFVREAHTLPTEAFNASPSPLKGERAGVRGENGSVARDLLIWQLADSAFPTGGFAHSGGLEALWQHRLIRSGREFLDFLQTALRQLGHGSLPFVNAACDANVDEFAKVDRLCDAFTSNHVANRASRLQGKAFLNSSETIFANGELTALRSAVRDQEMPGHFAPVFGAVSSALKIERSVMVRLFMFVHLRGWIGSAVRLGIVGPLEGQTLHHQMGTFAEHVGTHSANLTLDDVAQSVPMIDLFQATQDRLYSRLFQS
jgi:urease accessory protein